MLDKNKSGALTENNPPNTKSIYVRFINIYILKIEKMAIKIDKEKCIGCGACVAVCPKAFEMKSDKAAIKDANSKEACVKEAKETCPVSAISVS